jgi:hypothetical protein
MTRFLLVVLLLLVAAYFGWRQMQQPSPPPAPAVVVEATPAPTPEGTPEPLAAPRVAPEGMVYVVRRFTVSTPQGVHAFTPGREVRFIREEPGYYVVADGEVQGRAPRLWFTRDAEEAHALREEHLSAEEVAARLLEQSQQEAADFEARERAKVDAFAGALEGRGTTTAPATKPEPAPAAAPPAEAPSGPLRIGAWNLEFFGSRKDPPRTKEDVQAIADYIRRLGVVALVLTEVDGEGPVRELCRLIGPTWKSIVGSSKKGGNAAAPEQAVAIIWDDARLDLVSGGELRQMPRSLEGLPIFHRLPVSAALRDRRGGPDFRMVGVHFKAGRDPDSNRKRQLEIGEVRRYLDELRARESEDRDVVLLGDFNSGDDFPEAKTLTAGREFSYLTKPGGGTTIIHFNRQIDHIVPAADFKEIQAGSFDIHNREGLANREAWRNRYSDHFPISVSVSQTPDDDPKAAFSPPGG